MFSLPFQVFLEVESVVAAELSPEVLVLVAGSEVASVVAEPEVFALVFAAAELSPEVLVLVAEPEVASVVAEPEVVFVAVVSVAEPPVSVDIAVAFVALVPAAVVVGEVDSSGRPKFPAVPMSIILPTLPVLLKSLVRYPFIVPPVPVPITVSVVALQPGSTSK